MVANAMRRPYYMDATKAREFGVIDKVITFIIMPTVPRLKCLLKWLEVLKVYQVGFLTNASYFVQILWPDQEDTKIIADVADAL